MNRRMFLGCGAAAVVRADVLPNSRIALGVIGAGWMGLATMKIFMGDQRVQIAGAILLPMSELAARVAELEPQRQAPLIVYCHHGGRSLRVAEWLRTQGFQRAQSMAGGIDEWAVHIDRSLARY